MDFKLFLGKKNKMAKFEKIGPEKKNSFWKKKNKLARNRVSEWGLNFSREKIKYGTFGRSKILIDTRRRKKGQKQCGAHGEF